MYRVKYLNSIIVKGTYYKSKNKQGSYGTSTSEKLRCMERHRETQVYMTTLAKISAIKKTAEKGDMTMVTSGVWKKNNKNINYSLRDDDDITAQIASATAAMGALKEVWRNPHLDV
jgi:hypothetical protein